LLLIDDGSGDASADICKRYIGNNVKYHYHKNHGVSYTRNAGIYLARNDYIIFVDADDYLIAGWRAVIEAALDSNYEVVFFSESSRQYSRKELFDHLICYSATAAGIPPSACWKVYQRNFLKNKNILWLSK